jgi:RNAse (barnase) inhibitor barstar
MHSFAQLLSCVPSGLYLLSGDWRWGTIDRLCRLKGVRLFRIDGRSTHDKKRFLAAAARAMDFPRWFGANWDAFADCVSDLEWAPADAYLVLLGDMQGFAARAPRDFHTALEVLEAAAQFWNEKGVPFHVLVAAETDPGGSPLSRSALPLVRAP